MPVYADDRTDRLSALIADPIRRPVNVIVGNILTALAAKAATKTVPVVFVTGTDPVRDGLVAKPQPAGRQRHRRKLPGHHAGSKTPGAVGIGSPSGARKPRARLKTLKDRAEALYLTADPLLNTNRTPINSLANVVLLPTIANTRDFAEAGSLMSYGPNYPDLFRRAADYVDKILKGAKPGDLPVEQPTKFDLVINLTTAKAIGLAIPRLLGRADEVIE